MASTTAGRARTGEGGQAEAAERESAVEPYRVTPKLARRLAILGALLLIGFAALVMRLWTLQVLAGSEYAARANANQTREIPVRAERGAVVDRNGNALVTSAAVTAVDLYPSALPKVGPRRQPRARGRSPASHMFPSARSAGRSDRQERRTTCSTRSSYRAEAPARARDVPPGAGEPVPRRQPRPDLRPPVSPRRSRGAALRRRRADHRRRSRRRRRTRSFQSGDEIGQSGIEYAFNSLPAGHRRLGARARRLLRPPPQPAGAHQGGHARADRSADARHGPPAVRAECARVRDPARAQQRPMGRRRWRDRRDGSADRRDSRGGVLADVQPGDLLGPRDAARSSTTPGSAARSRRSPTTIRFSIAPSTPSIRPARSSSRSRRSRPYRRGSSTRPRSSRAPAPTSRPKTLGKHVWHNWDPTVNQGMALPTAIAYSCDTYFYRLGNAFYLLPPDRGQPEQKWAREFGFGRPAPIEIGPQAKRPPADDRLEAPRRSRARRTRRTGRSTASGSRETRSSSRSGRETSP